MLLTMLPKDVYKRQKENSDYNHYLSEARKYAELDITKYAIENYNKALTGQQ